MAKNWREISVEIESLVALVALVAGGVIPPLLLMPCIIEGAMRNDVVEIAVFAGLALASVAGAIWVGSMARAAMVGSCPRLAAIAGEQRRFVRRDNDAPPHSAPLAVVMAGQMPRIPRLLRPVVGLWWIAYFAGAVALGLLANGALQEILKNAPLHQRVLLPLGFYLPLVFVANVYLLLAAAVFVRNPAVHAKLWRWRLVIDLALTFIAWGLGMQG